MYVDIYGGTHQLAESDTDRAEVESLAKLTSAWNAYATWRDAKVVSAVEAGREVDALVAFRTDGAQKSAAVGDAASVFLDSKREIAPDTQASSDANAARARVITIAAAALCQ
jgi:hypothetical protein